MCITGDPGEGKSLTACKIGEKLDPTFSIDKVAYTGRQFMNIVGNVKRVGEVVVWDEAGVGLASREWHSASNKAINYVIQTFRKDHACVIFVTPDLSFIDVQARKLLRCYTEARRYRKEPVQLWIYKTSVARRTGDIYYPHPIYKVNGVRQKLFYARISMPSPELVKAYETKANKWKEKLKRSVGKTMDTFDQKADVGETIFDLINKVANSREEYSKDDKLNIYIIQTKLGISRHKAEQIKAMLKPVPSPEKKV